MADHSHGRLFDNFSAAPSHTHGGSYFDAGFGLQTIRDAHGKLHDLFGAQRGADEHGPRFDNFGWQDMPALHGQLFDSDFRRETAHDGSDGHGTWYSSDGHGTWFDAFRGGTQVKYMLDGADYEGTVIDVNSEFAKVRSHEGQTHEVGLSQFLAYRTPNEHQESPATPASQADAPSAHSHDAHGGGRHSVPSDLPPVVQETPKGQATDARSGVPDGIMDTFTHLKSLAADMDVEKSMLRTGSSFIGKPCTNCGGNAHMLGVKSGGNAPKSGGSWSHSTCLNCGTPHKVGEVASANTFKVAKDVDATETATQAQDLDDSTDGKHAWCPHCQHECKKVTSEGTCPTCGAKVTVGKATTGDLAIDVPEREHKSTDHHSSQKLPGRCPHCGGALDAVDHQTEQGQPSRTHKCVGTGLDVLKTLSEA